MVANRTFGRERRIVRTPGPAGVSPSRSPTARPRRAAAANSLRARISIDRAEVVVQRGLCGRSVVAPTRRAGRTRDAGPPGAGGHARGFAGGLRRAKRRTFRLDPAVSRRYVRDR